VPSASEPHELDRAQLAALTGWLNSIPGVPSDPCDPAPTGEALPTVPAMLALGAAAGSGGPAALLSGPLADRPGAAVVHGEQRIELSRAPRAGDRLVFASELVSARQLGGSSVLSVATTVRTAADEPVANLRSTFVVTSGEPA